MNLTIYLENSNIFRNLVVKIYYYYKFYIKFLVMQKNSLFKTLFYIRISNRRFIHNKKEQYLY